MGSELWSPQVTTTRVPFCGRLWQSRHNVPQVTHNPPQHAVVDSGELWQVVKPQESTGVSGVRFSVTVCSSCHPFSSSYEMIDFVWKSRRRDS